VLADRSQHVCAVTRSGRLPRGIRRADPFVSCAVGDITNYESIEQILRQSSPTGVIWAVTSSGPKKEEGGGGGGDVFEVDYQGARNVARACLACGIPKLVLISAGCVSRPNALGSKLVNAMARLACTCRKLSA